MSKGQSQLWYSLLGWMLVLSCLQGQSETSAQENPAIPIATSSQLEQAARLYARGEQLYKAGKYHEATEPVLQSLQIREAVLGPSHPDVAASLHLLGRLYTENAEFAQAESLLQRTLHIRETALGPNHPDVATSLNALAGLFVKKADLSQAETLYQRALKIREDTRGPAFAEVAETMAGLGILYLERDEVDKAQPLLERALALREQTLGKDHPDVAKSCGTLGDLYRQKRELNRAEEFYQRALTIREQALGPTHPDTATSLIDLASVYIGRSDYVRAQPLLYRGRSIREAAFGSEHPSIADVFSQQAALYQGQKKYDEAFALFERALVMRKRTLGSKHPLVALSLLNLAIVRAEHGSFDQASAFIEESLHLVEQRYGTEHRAVKAARAVRDMMAALASGKAKEVQSWFEQNLTDTTKLLGPPKQDTPEDNEVLAVVYFFNGEYAKAEELFHQVLAEKKRTLGPRHPAVVPTLNFLNQVYLEQGKYTKAEPTCVEAMRLAKEAREVEPRDVLVAYRTLAALYSAKADYRKAEPLLQEALRIADNSSDIMPLKAGVLNNLAMLYLDQEKDEQAIQFAEQALTQMRTAAEKMPILRTLVATTMNNLGVGYLAQGQISKAESILREALALQEQAVGPNHDDVATTLNNLASLYFRRGEYDQAEPLYRRALTIFEQQLGPRHPAVASLGLMNLAWLYWVKGERAQAVSLLTRALEIQEYNLGLILTTGAEQQKRTYLDSLTKGTGTVISWHAQTKGDLQLCRLAFLTLLRRKGRILETMTSTLAELRQRLRPEDQQLLAQWNATRTQLANVFRQNVDEQNPEQYRKRINAIEERIQQLEAQISTRNAEFFSHVQPVTIEQVQQKIPVGVVLVELTTYSPVSPKGQQPTDDSGKPRYAAFILPHEGELTSVDLGAREPIDANVRKLRAVLSGRRKDVRDIARQLDEQIMRPLRPFLGENKLVLLSPDGMLNLVPFGALIDEDGQYLAKRFTFDYLTTGRDLLRMQHSNVLPQKPVLIADPDFNATSNNSMSRHAHNKSESRGQRSTDFGSLQFGPLPGTAQEAKGIRRQLVGAVVLTGTKATETALKQVHGPQILHLATHGFFLIDQPVEPPDSRGATVVASFPFAFPPVGASSLTDVSRLQPSVARVKTEDPLLRSGLALAGFNHRQSGAEDGVLTALEVAGLDLRGTQLVVLSACETGVGEVQVGEGVYGLRRALVMAGAETQVLSLWKVADDATRDLMVSFYQRLLKGEGRAEALRQVQLNMLKSEQYAHPYYWASFISSGDWRPLAH